MFLFSTFIGEIGRGHVRLKGEVPTPSHLLFGTSLKYGTMKEIWKDIFGYKGYYQVSNYGRIKSLEREKRSGKGYKTIEIKPEKILTPSRNRYLSVNFSINGRKRRRTLHRIVAKAFIPNPEAKPCVNHLNGITYDNRAVNLEWCTRSENDIHAYKIGLRVCHNKGKRGEHNWRSKPVNQYDLDGNYIATHESIRLASDATGISNGNISEACNGIKKRTKNYKWKFA